MLRVLLTSLLTVWLFVATAAAGDSQSESAYILTADPADTVVARSSDGNIVRKDKAGGGSGSQPVFRSEPGFPSLGLAKALAGQDGGELPSLNWSVKAVPK